MFSLKKFLNSTILGLMLGIFLAAYAVSAFTSPTLAPPGGNPPASLNTSSSDQTKQGGTLNVFGLWVNQALGVTGGATIGGVLNLQGNKIINVGAPSLSGDVATKGFVDTLTSNLQTRVSGSCPAGQGIRTVGADGSVTCETMPAGLRNTDVVAAGSILPTSLSTTCNQPQPGNRCDAYFFVGYTSYSRLVWHDPRSVLTANFPQVALPCYEIPNGSDRACGAQRTVQGSPSFSCSGGFVADTGHPIASALANHVTCFFRGGCPAAVCRPP